MFSLQLAAVSVLGLAFMAVGPIVVLFVGQIFRQQRLVTGSELMLGLAVGMGSWFGGSFKLMTEVWHLNELFSIVVVAVWLLTAIYLYFTKIMQ